MELKNQEGYTQAGNNVFKITAIMSCLILTSCVSNHFLHIQAYPSQISENDIGSVNIFTQCFHFTHFWNEFDYDLNKELLLYKDSVWICQKGKVSSVTLFTEDSRNYEDKQIQLSGKGTLYFRFYSNDFVKLGDTVMLHTRNSIFTPSGVFPLDSVQFIVGERIRMKHYFTRWKGNCKYGYYAVSL